MSEQEQIKQQEIQEDIQQQDQQDNDNQPLSKKAIKRQQKHERLKKQKEMKKQRRKDAKQLQKQQKKEQQQQENNEEQNNRKNDNELTELQKKEKEERLLQLNEKYDGLSMGQAKRQVKKDQYNEKQKDGVKVVLDMQYQDMLGEQELKSLANQIVFNYSANKKEDKPLNYIVSSYKEGCPVDNLLKQRDQGGLNIQYEEQHFIDLFKDQKENLIYLTGDAEEEMEELEKDKIYIIGGMVDHNRLKCLSYNKAKELGVKTQKFPISKHVKLYTSEILNINHVFLILNKLKNGADWATALTEVIPKRKRENRGANQYVRVEEIEKRIMLKKQKQEEEKQIQQLQDQENNEQQQQETQDKQENE